MGRIKLRNPGSRQRITPIDLDDPDHMAGVTNMLHGITLCLTEHFRGKPPHVNLIPTVIDADGETVPSPWPEIAFLSRPTVEQPNRADDDGRVWLMQQLGYKPTTAKTILDAVGSLIRGDTTASIPPPLFITIP